MKSSPVKAIWVAEAYPLHLLPASADAAASLGRISLDRASLAKLVTAENNI
jgi:hypothetical protein